MEEKIEEINRPRCAKCDKPALSYFNDMWICGQCLADFCNKQKELNRKMVLEG